MNEEDALRLATGVEYFHTASLLLDDLPCMDDALQRRGFPTVHSVYEEDSAILGALALVNRAYTLIWRSMQSASEEHRCRAGDYLDSCLGITGILGGQSRDVHMNSGAKTAEVIRVAYEKTVSLVKLTMVLPALITGSEDARELERLAIYWGLAYQVSDDLKDVISSAEFTGKTVRQDREKGRPNIAVSAGTEAAVQRMFRYVSKGDSVLGRLVSSRREWVFLSSMRHRFEQELTYWTDEQSSDEGVTNMIASA